LYYGIEGDHLYRVIKSALNNKDRLEEMGKAARKHCIRYHTVSKILQHVVETTLLETNQKEK
jgi:DNA-binding transcriptional regulator YhcF (GntR family)